jgi:predicted amidohydrolase
LSVFKLAVLPMTSIDDPVTNLQFIKKAIDRLDADTRLLCLPENSLFLNLDKNPIPKKAALHPESKEIKVLQQLAREKHLYIHLGGIPWLINDEVFNEALLITDQGEIIESYEKIHLFDVNLGPGIEVTESKSYRRGNRFAVFEIDDWKFATCICYDLRFPELFLNYMQTDNVDAFIVPAAFTTKTGEVHWKALLQARAIECQTYVIAPAQVGYHRDFKLEKLRKTWGQSLVIGPWGRIEMETPNYRDIMDSNLNEHEPITTVLDKQKLADYRRSVPIHQHRRYRVELIEK